MTAENNTGGAKMAVNSKSMKKKKEFKYRSRVLLPALPLFGNAARHVALTEATHIATVILLNSTCGT